MPETEMSHLRGLMQVPGDALSKDMGDGDPGGCSARLGGRIWVCWRTEALFKARDIIQGGKKAFLLFSP
ncbi:hypothetical protein GRJ2_001216900 [Grus japonensis]|uniref:Uncharacterized protein n=1 Tax=Grus japonensis TaxID=30415 RepID=A0ABC9WQF8_GRUJA